MATNPFISKESLGEVAEWVMNTPPPQMLIDWPNKVSSCPYGVTHGIGNNYVNGRPTKSAYLDYSGGFWNKPQLDEYLIPAGQCVETYNTTPAVNYFLSVPITGWVRKYSYMTEFNLVTFYPKTCTFTLDYSRTPCWYVDINYSSIPFDIIASNDSIKKHVIDVSLKIKPELNPSSNVNVRVLTMENLTWKYYLNSDGVWGLTENTLSPTEEGYKGIII